MSTTDREIADSAILFAIDIIEQAWEDGPTEEQQSMLDVAEHQGIVRWRAPTEAELADPDWWGHAWDITADNETGVGEIDPEFRKAAERAAKARQQPTT